MFEVEGQGFMVSGFGFKVQRLVFEVEGQGFMVSGFGCKV